MLHFVQKKDSIVNTNCCLVWSATLFYWSQLIFFLEFWNQNVAKELSHFHFCESFSGKQEANQVPDEGFERKKQNTHEYQTEYFRQYAKYLIITTKDVHGSTNTYSQ